MEKASADNDVQSDVPETPQTYEQLIKYLKENPEIKYVVYCDWPTEMSILWLGLVTNEETGKKGRGDLQLSKAEFTKLLQYCNKHLPGRIIFKEKEH